MPKPDSKKADVKVSVLCITYNQEQYIAQTLEGIFMQNTNFTFEVLVHDDASTDETRTIIDRFDRKYPGIIRPMYEKKNQFSMNDKTFLKTMFTEAKGKYIAICEGDDYWTDPLKLQKQVDFLDSHESYDIVFHPVSVVFENHERGDEVFPIPTKERYTLERLLRENYIQTNSILYRRQDYKDIVPEVMPFDWYMHLMHAKNGHIGFIDEVMSVYRRHDGGIWWGTAHNDRDAIWKKHSTAHVLLYTELLEMFKGDRYHAIIDRHIEGTMNILSRIDTEDGTDLIGTFVRIHPERCGVLVLSLSRTTYKNYRQVEKTELETKNEIERMHGLLNSANGEILALRESREAILNSKTYRLGNKIAHVTRVIRRKHEE